MLFRSAGLAALRRVSPELASRLKVHFVGPGSSPDDPKGHRVMPRARQAGVEDMVDEHPNRIGYVDALNHLECSSAVLVLGSTEPHYTPSKVFQGLLSRRPLFAMLHEASTAVALVRSSHAGRAMTLTDTRLPAPEAVAMELASLMTDTSYDADAVDRSAFTAFTARESTRLLAEALDSVLPRGSAGT